jgi:hypothetical protein
MIARPTLARRRGGATMVETAVVISIFLLFIFGIFEYCRFLFMLQLTTNAAREGARYATVNVDKPSNFKDTAYTITYTTPTGTETRTYLPIRQYVDERMGTGKKQLLNYAVDIFPCDSAQLAQAPPVIAPKATAVAWNDATFGERIAVRITGDFKPLLPNFLRMSSTIPINVTVTMGSEG